MPNLEPATTFALRLVDDIRAVDLVDDGEAADYALAAGRIILRDMQVRRAAIGEVLAIIAERGGELCGLHVEIENLLDES
jgi:hypothetical protein